MKHTVEIKMPKLFGRKEKVDETEVKEESVNIEEVVIDAIGETKKRIEETNNHIKDTLKIVAPVATALAIGYVAGFNRGLMKSMVKNASERIIVINK